MRLEDEGKHFCYKITTNQDCIYYVVARTLSVASSRAYAKFEDNVCKIEFVGEAIK